MLVSDCQGVSKVVKYFEPQRVDAKDKGGHLLILGGLVVCLWFVCGCHSFSSACE